MPGIINTSSAASVGYIAGMKGNSIEGPAPSYGEPHPKKRKLTHKLHHTQPTQHISETLNAEIDPFGVNKDFFDRQLQRAIAIECKTVGFDGARPEALEAFRGLADGCKSLLSLQSDLSDFSKITSLTICSHAPFSRTCPTEYGCFVSNIDSTVRLDPCAQENGHIWVVPHRRSSRHG